MIKPITDKKKIDGLEKVLSMKCISKETAKKAEAIEAEPIRHGNWINISISTNGIDSSAECDLCGAIVHNNFSSTINYCPNCGAKMDGEGRKEIK